MVTQAGHFWGSLLTLVDPENHQELFKTRSDLIFDPQMWDFWMLLSTDKRMIYDHWLSKCSATLLIQSTKSVPNFQSWAVSLFKDCAWIIGLCDKQSAKSLKDGHVYGLCFKDNQPSSLINPPSFVQLGN